MADRRIFLCTTRDGWEHFDTAEEARACFDAEVRAIREDVLAEDQWPDIAEHHVCGELLPLARTALVETDGAEEDGSGVAYDLVVNDRLDCPGGGEAPFGCDVCDPESSVAAAHAHLVNASHVPDAHANPALREAAEAVHALLGGSHA